MSLAKIKHQLNPDGGVTLAIINGGTRIVQITEDDAKRLAWAILSDLEPEEALRVDWEDPAVKDLRQMDKSQCEMALEILDDGPTATSNIGDRVGITRNQAAVVLNRAKERGLVKVIMRAKLTLGFGRTQNVWAITDAGRLQLALYRQVNTRFAAE